MGKIILAIGSRRGPKLNAVSEALHDISILLAPGAQFEIVGVEVASGVGHTPLSREELMMGARQRAEALVRLARESGAGWRYFIGMEGGLDVIRGGASLDEMQQDWHPNQVGDRRVFLESWAYVSDGVRGHYGRSGAIEVPEGLACQVLENGVELSEAIDRFAGGAGIRDAQGAWGVLSSNLITRQEAFRLAVIAAFAPFYNGCMYRAAAGAW